MTPNPTNEASERVVVTLLASVVAGVTQDAEDAAAGLTTVADHICRSEGNLWALERLADALGLTEAIAPQVAEAMAEHLVDREEGAAPVTHLIGIKCTTAPPESAAHLNVYPGGDAAPGVGFHPLILPEAEAVAFERARLDLFKAIADRLAVPLVELGLGDGYEDWLATGTVESLREFADALASAGLARPHTGIFAPDEALVAAAAAAFRPAWPDVELCDWEELGYDPAVEEDDDATLDSLLNSAVMGGNVEEYNALLRGALG